MAQAWDANELGTCLGADTRPTWFRPPRSPVAPSHNGVLCRQPTPGGTTRTDHLILIYFTACLFGNSAPIFDYQYYVIEDAMGRYLHTTS